MEKLKKLENIRRNIFWIIYMEILSPIIIIKENMQELENHFNFVE